MFSKDALKGQRILVTGGGSGLGKELMKYILDALREMDIERVTLFADADVIPFYKSQGWTLEPKGNKCAFWYAN